MANVTGMARHQATAQQRAGGKQRRGEAPGLLHTEHAVLDEATAAGEGKQPPPIDGVGTAKGVEIVIEHVGARMDQGNVSTAASASSAPRRPQASANPTNTGSTEAVRNAGRVAANSVTIRLATLRPWNTSTLGSGIGEPGQTSQFPTFLVYTWNVHDRPTALIPQLGGVREKSKPDPCQLALCAQEIKGLPSGGNGLAPIAVWVTLSQA